MSAGILAAGQCFRYGWSQARASWVCMQGLGKTVELLACILANRYEGPRLPPELVGTLASSAAHCCSFCPKKARCHPSLLTHKVSSRKISHLRKLVHGAGRMRRRQLGSRMRWCGAPAGPRTAARRRPASQVCGCSATGAGAGSTARALATPRPPQKVETLSGPAVMCLWLIAFLSLHALCWVCQSSWLAEQ